jgi:hypothetical protein
LAIEVPFSDNHFKTDNITIYYEGILCAHNNPTDVMTEGETFAEILQALHTIMKRYVQCATRQGSFETKTPSHTLLNLQQKPMLMHYPMPSTLHT